MAFKAGSFSDKQLDVMLNCNAPINALEGSVRSGKTIASLFALVFLLPQYPHGNILLVGKTDKTLYRNIIKPLEEMFGSKNIVFRRGSGEGELFGHFFFAAGANDEKATSKIQGMTLSLAYGDEVTTWNESFFQMLLSRLSDPNAKFIGTMNPESPYHWFKVNYLDREGQIAIKVWKFLLEENKNLPEEYVKNLKTFYTGLFYKRYILGEWCLAEGAVYENFDESIHVAPVPDSIWRIIVNKHVSIDYGTTNPTVFHLWGNDGHRRFLKKEYYYSSKVAGRQKTDADYATDLINFIGDEDVTIIVDPSAASFKAELNKRGLFVMDANNDVLEGIKKVSNELQACTIQIDPSCINTIQEFGSYVWDIKACERGEDKPLKEFDHAMDSIRYYINTVDVYQYSSWTSSNDKIGYSLADQYDGVFD